jgi:hypothetical protein
MEAADHWLSENLAQALDGPSDETAFVLSDFADVRLEQTPVDHSERHVIARQ